MYKGIKAAHIKNEWARDGNFGFGLKFTLKKSVKIFIDIIENLLKKIHFNLAKIPGLKLKISTPFHYKFCFCLRKQIVKKKLHRIKKNFGERVHILIN